MDARLDEVGARLERLATAPQQIEASGWLQLTRPLLRLVGWQPQYRIAEVGELLAALRDLPADSAVGARESNLERAIAELEDNVALAERACAVNGQVAVAQLSWMQRLARVLGLVLRATRATGSARGLQLSAAIHPLALAPPLTIAGTPDSEPSGGETVDLAATTLVDLQLSAIDHIIEAAQAETGFIERRRRLLEAARRLLLDADAALPLDPEGARLRKRYLAEEIAHLDRVQAAGISARVGLLHQARSALSRKQRQRLHAALVAMEGFALAAGDSAVSERASRALALLERGGDDKSPQAFAASLRRSASEIYGEEVNGAIGKAYHAARTELDEAKRPGDEELADLAAAYLAPGGEQSTLSAMLSVDGLFDVGAPLNPVRARESETVARLVPFPTEEMVLARARGLEDLPAALIEDPRTLLMDLAAGRLLTRKYVHHEERQRERTELVGEVRVYLLDGSTSMLQDGVAGGRARMRDAILVAELSTLLERFRHPQRYTRVVLYYRYFTKLIQPLRRVSQADEALAALGDVLGSPRLGGTDIEKALCSSFDTIREAQGRDPELAQAQIVLITDGMSVVRESAVRRARERIGALPVGVSVIALGEENRALRGLVARQRALGQRAFYHFVDDATLAELCEGQLDRRRTLHLFGGDQIDTAAELSTELEAVLHELADLERERLRVARRTHQDTCDDDRSPERLSSAVAAEPSRREGRQAQMAAAERDRRAVLQRYLRWFPPPRPQQELDAIDADEVAATLVVLATVAEVLGELGGDELSRKADAIDIVERLLPDARLSPERFRAVLWAGGDEVDEALAVVHRVCGPTG